MEPITIHKIPTEKEYILINREYSRINWKNEAGTIVIRVFYILLFVSSAVLFYTSDLFPYFDQVIFSFPMVLAAFYFIFELAGMIKAALNPGWINKEAMTNPFFLSPLTIELNETGWKTTCETGESILYWKGFTKYVQTKNFIFASFYGQNSQVKLLSKSAFQSDEQLKRFLDFLDQLSAAKENEYLLIRP